MHGKNSSALSMLEKIPRNVTADSDIVTTDSEKIEKSVTINRNGRSRCVGIRTSEGRVRVAYQCEIEVTYKGDKKETAIPYTFEDALALANIGSFRERGDAIGLLGKMAKALSEPTLGEACIKMFEAIESGKKAEMALDLLYTMEPNELQPPEYIAEGLDWLWAKLQAQSHAIHGQNPANGGKAHE
uniref:Uncharacterized protein n=2 Tax=unclassified Candidatus Kentrum TaxID=2643149 RepID=A0A450YX70_9GAMM|nr:MAG: hypothetical protein BECKSD772F_GA0070984_12812 [Candidatus Kentron sp. SD]VFK49873.1 MAG: hypothetical protein BECKSD772E_GA0070983_12671 [Candidatus Kentron sp. SD]